MHEDDKIEKWEKYYQKMRSKSINEKTNQKSKKFKVINQKKNQVNILFPNLIFLKAIH